MSCIRLSSLRVSNELLPETLKAPRIIIVIGQVISCRGFSGSRGCARVSHMPGLQSWLSCRVCRESLRVMVNTCGTCSSMTSKVGAVYSKGSINGRLACTDGLKPLERAQFTKRHLIAQTHWEKKARLKGFCKPLTRTNARFLTGVELGLDFTPLKWRVLATGVQGLLYLPHFQSPQEKIVLMRWFICQVWRWRHTCIPRQDSSISFACSNLFQGIRPFGIGWVACGQWITDGIIVNVRDKLATLKDFCPRLVCRPHRHELTLKNNGLGRLSS